MSDQFWAQFFYTDILNEHTHFKERALKDEHVYFMHSQLRKQIYKKQVCKVYGLTNEACEFMSS